MEDENTMGVSTQAVAAGPDSSSNGSSSSGSSNRNSGKSKKRPRDSKPQLSRATVVITDAHHFRAKVHKFTGMPTPHAGNTFEDSERPPLLFKPRARRAAINVPLTMISTVCCNLPATDHLLNLPLMEGDPPVEARTSNSLLQLPAFGDNEGSNYESNDNVSLLFEELWDELELTQNVAI